MKFLLIHDTRTGAFGGTERNVLGFAEYLRSCHHTVGLVEVGKPVLRAMFNAPLDFYAAVDDAPLEKIAQESWRRILLNFGPDTVVLAKGWVGRFSTALDQLIKTQGIRYVAWEQHPAPVRAGVVQRTWRAVRNPRETLALRSARLSHLGAVTKHIAVSQYVAVMAAQFLGGASHTIEVVYPAIDFDQFSRQPDRRERARSQFSLPHEAIVVGTLGRLVRHKQTSMVLELFRTVRDAYPQLPLWCLISGTGPEEAALVAQARALGVSDRTRFVGWQSEAETVWNAIDVFPFPSLDEGLGLALVEAIGCGSLALCSNVGGMPEVFGEATPENVLPATSSVHWEQAMLRAIGQSTDDRTSSWKAQYRAVHARFSAPQQWQQLLDRIVCAGH